MALVALLMGSCTTQNKNKLIIFHAGSLSVPFKQIADSFETKHPGVNVQLEAAGSRACARKITDLNKPCDIMASADYSVIDNLLIPNHATWNLKFASNEMAIVFHEASNYQEQINQDNWFDIMLKEDVAYGRSDPDSDPCGYRSVLVCRLSEKYYNRPGMADSLLAKDNHHIRPKEVDLIALLETEIIDYIFLYRSVAEQHGLKYLILPDSINLKKPALANYYATVSVDVTGKKPGETITHKGEPMIYGITQVTSAPNPELAEKFLKFFFADGVGIHIMEQNGQPSVIPSETSTFNHLPNDLKRYAKEH